MDNRVYNKEYYSRIFGQKARQYYIMSRDKIRKVLNMFEVCDGGRILDIGCADGYMTSLIGEKTKAKMYGIDISQKCLEKAAKMGVITKALDVDGKKLPYKPAYFDAVFCGDIIEHVCDTEGLLENIHSVLKADGYLVVSIPNIAAWYNRFFLLFGYMPIWIEPSSKTYTGNPFMKEGYGHVKAFTKRALVELLRFKKFKVEGVVGCPLLGDGSRLMVAEKVWNGVDTFFSKLNPSLASTVIVKARKC